jgi:hypothetical protein
MTAFPISNLAPRRNTMKHLKLLSGLALALFAVLGVGFLPTAANEAHATMSYECWTHPGGKPDKMVHVSADNNSQAVALAIEKFKAIGVNPVGVTCK